MKKNQFHNIHYKFVNDKRPFDLTYVGDFLLRYKLCKNSKRDLNIFYSKLIMRNVLCGNAQIMLVKRVVTILEVFFLLK